MPEIKISQLTSASTPAGTEVLAIVQSGDTKKTTINSLASALEDNLSTGAPTWTTAGVLTAGHDIIAGGNDDGRVALTINDGYGNANLTFNHASGIPDRSGSSARITSSVDSNQELLDFQLKSSVTSGTPTALTSVLKLYEDGIQLLKPTTLSSNGTSSTSLVNKGYIDTALTGKANTNHTHSQYSLNTHLHDDRYSQIGHGHSIANISNLQTILNGKIGETEINTAQFVFSNNMLQLRTIQEGQIATGAITNTKIENGAITNDKIATNTITAGKIAANAVNSSEIANGAVDFEHLNAADVVTSSEGIGNNNSNTKIPTSAAVKSYVNSVDNSSVIAGLLSIPLSSNYPSYYIQGTVISGSLTGVWSGTGRKTKESITLSLRNLSSGSNTVNSFYTLTQNVAQDDRQFSVTRTFTRSAYTIPSSGLYQLTSTSGFTTTSGVTATPPA